MSFAIFTIFLLAELTFANHSARDELPTKTEWFILIWVSPGSTQIYYKHNATGKKNCSTLLRIKKSRLRWSFNKETFGANSYLWLCEYDVNVLKGPFKIPILLLALVFRTNCNISFLMPIHFLEVSHFRHLQALGKEIGPNGFILLPVLFQNNKIGY